MKPSDSKNDSSLAEDYTSKSELKRQMHELQALGESLLALAVQQIHALPIGEELQEAIILAQKMKHDNGRRRQLQRIGKLMRHEDIEAIERQLNTAKHTAQQQAAEHRQRQQLVDQHIRALIDNTSDALTTFLQEHPQANRQRLRQLISHIHKANKDKPETEQVINSKHFKKLKQEIESVLLLSS